MIRSRMFARVVALTLVIGLLWVPIAVRSARRLGQRGAVTLRLNHGFDLPVERQLAPPADVLTATRYLPIDVADASAVIGDVAVPDEPDRLTIAEAIPPDPLRGPPARSLA